MPQRLAGCVFAFAFGILALPVTAQVTNVTGQLSPPVPGAGHDYIHLLNETVSPGTGGLSIQISIPVPAGRGITPALAFGYESNLTHIFVPPTPGSAAIKPYAVSYLGQNGWSLTLPQLTMLENEQTVEYSTSPPEFSHCFYYTNFVFTDMQGGTHNLNLSTSEQEYSTCVSGYNSANPNYLAGGDGLLLAVAGDGSQTFNPTPVTVTDQDGSVYYFSNSSSRLHLTTPLEYTSLPDWIEDRNGNKLTITDSSSALSVTDTLGRTIAFSPVKVTVPGVAAPYQAATSAEPSDWTYNSEVFKGVADDNCPAKLSQTFVASQLEFSEISLPNGQSFQFQYDATSGLISKIIYPSGGYVRYVWGNSPLAEGMGWSDSTVSGGECWALHDTQAVIDRYVSFDGTTEVLHQHFNYSTSLNTTYWSPTPSGRTTTVTTYYGPGLATSFNTVYNYKLAGLPKPPNDKVSPFGSSTFPLETSVLYYGTNGALLRTVSKNYVAGPDYPPDETIALDNGQTSQITHDYVGVSGITRLADLYEYDFGASAPGTLLRQTQYNYATFAASPLFPSTPSILDRPSSVITYNGAGTRVAETDYSYDQTSTASASATQHDETNYASGSTAPRANATTITKQCFPGCTNAVTTYTYDETGQVLSMKDPCGNATCSDMTGTNHTTTYAYLDSYSSCGGAAPPSGNTNAYLTSVTNPLGQTNKYCYGYTDGQLRGSTDQNSQSTTYAYNDSLGRLTQTVRPDSGQTNYTYNDAPPTPSVATSQTIVAGTNLTSLAVMDGLGHVTDQELTSDPSGTDYTVTAYDGLGRPSTLYNPTRCNPPTTNCGAETTWGYESFTYDALGRATKVLEQDNSTATTVYSGNTTAVTDEAGHVRESATDGLSRLTSVREAPTGLDFLTTYTYDALDNLLTVVQDNSRSRSFAYDSLSRLTSSSNPEISSGGVSCPVTFTYDVNSNLSAKASPQTNQASCSTRVQTANNYDVLNRPVAVSYSDATPPVTYVYDTAGYDGLPLVNTVGRMVFVANSSAGNAAEKFFSYDVMGRPNLVRDCLYTGSCYQFSAAYNDLGGLKQLIYPGSNPLTVNYAPGAAGLPLSAIDTNSINYVSTAHYSPAGAPCSEGFGSGPAITATWVYNFRLQPSRIQTTTTGAPGTPCATPTQTGNLLDFTFNFSPGTDNGNVMGITNNRDTTRSQSFAYDALNRLTTAETASTYSTSPAHCWGEAYVYDNQPSGGAWGNLTNINVASSAYNGCTQESLSVISTAQNQLSGYGYDAAGNMTSISSVGSYSFNALNQLTSAAGVTYTYDPLGHRVEKSSGTLYLYGPSDSVLEETTLSGTLVNQYIYFGNARIARRDASGNVFYYSQDHLGTSRVLAEVPSGGSTATLCYDADFYPFGGERAYINTCAQNYKFTGKERDTESHLDNFSARYDSSTLGRFMSPDPGNAGADPTNPQSWNMYNYVLNNPLNFVDPTGMDCVYFNDAGNGVESIDHSSNGGECSKNGGDWVNGWTTTSQISYDSSSDMFSINSSDANNYYFTAASAPGSQNSGHDCFGDCTYGYAQTQMFSGSPSWGATFAKTFLTNFVSPSFYKSELDRGGCLNSFEQGAESADILGKVLPPGSTAVEDTIRAGAASQAFSYAATNGLTTPLRSSVVRGMLEFGETAAATFTAGYFDLQAGAGVFNEARSALKGTCH